MEKMVPEGRLHMRPFQFHFKEHWRFPQPLDSLLLGQRQFQLTYSGGKIRKKLLKGSDIHPKDHSNQLFTDASYKGWGAHLEQISTKGLWSDRKKGYT